MRKMGDMIGVGSKDPPLSCRMGSVTTLSSYGFVTYLQPLDFYTESRYITCMKPNTTNPHIQARLADYRKKIESQHSMFWMGRSVDELTEKLTEGSIEYVERLRRIQSAVGNFVKIVTEKDIPVVFSGGQSSYTNGKAVVLSADTDPAGLDALVGTSLHEGAHCK